MEEKTERVVGFASHFKDVRIMELMESVDQGAALSRVGENADFKEVFGGLSESEKEMATVFVLQESKKFPKHDEVHIIEYTKEKMEMVSEFMQKTMEYGGSVYDVDAMREHIADKLNASAGKNKFDADDKIVIETLMKYTTQAGA